MAQPLLVLDGGDGFTLSSRSAIIGGTASGHHLLNIDGYSHTKHLPTGQCIKSRPFAISSAGSYWRILYYPNADIPDAAEFISVFLELEHGITDSVDVQAKFSLLDQTGQPVPSHSQTTDMRKACTGDGGFGYNKFIKRSWLEDSGLLKDDCFTIRCDVFLPKDLRTEYRQDPPLVVVPPYELQLHLERLLTAKTGADVTFEVGGETFRAHRCILAARSRVFEAELFGPMKESADNTVIRIDDMQAEVFRALLCFLYTDGVPVCPALEQPALAQHLLVAADKYHLERLKLLCEQNLCKHIDTGSVFTILSLAEQHHCHGLKEACFNFLSSASTLNAAMATDGFGHFTRSCPAVLKDLMSNIATRLPPDY